MPSSPFDAASSIPPLARASRHAPTLKILRDRLSDLSMRNRSLRLARLTKSRAFDLAWLDRAADASSSRVLEALLSGRKATVKLLDVGTDDPDAIALHKGLVYLDRDVRLVEQERGVYDLSVGIGFLCGNIAEGRYLQAPLFLLPRRLVLERRPRDGARWVLAPVGEADTIDVNRTLLLALQRFLDVTIEPDEIEEQARQLFGRPRTAGWLDALATDIAAMLRERRVTVSPTSLVWDKPAGGKGVPALPVYKSEELPSTPVRRFELRPHAVLSRFPLADTALLKDYDELLTLLNAHPGQPLGYAGALLGDEESMASLARHAARPAPASPRWHVEPTDDSQEAILARAIGGQSLAVHGPPGTGKSQLIANLVATAAAQGKRVLVVSQKRPALDVVAQRLGADLGRFVALVHDPVRDRQELCDRMVRGIAAAENGGLVVDERERKRALDAVEREAGWFEAIHQALLQPSEGGTAYDAYVARMQHPGQPRGTVRALPTVTPADLDRELPLLDAYVADRRAARPSGTWLETRPDWSRLDADDRDVLAEEHLPAVVRALGEVLSWEKACPEGLPPLEEAARSFDAWTEVAGWTTRALRMPPIAWPLVTALALDAPNVARRSEDGELLKSVLREGPPAADRDATPWVPDRVEELPALQQAAEHHESWRAIAEWAANAGTVRASGWSWVRHLLANWGPDVRATLEEDARLLHDLLERRANADGRVVEPAGAVPVEELLRQYEAAAQAWYSFLFPSWYSVQTQVRQSLGLPADAGSAQIGAAIQAWRAARAYGAALASAGKQVKLLRWTGQDLRALLASELEDVVSDARTAVGVVLSWDAISAHAERCGAGGAPTYAVSTARLHAFALHRLEARGLLLDRTRQSAAVLREWFDLTKSAHAVAGRAPPTTAASASALRSRALHAVAARAQHAALQTAAAKLTRWIGAEADAWVDDARRSRAPDALGSRVEREVLASFSVLADLDRGCRDLESRAPALAELAWGMAKGGGDKVSNEIALAYAERRVRDAERTHEKLKELTPPEERRRRAVLHDAWQQLPQVNRRVLLSQLTKEASGIPGRDLTEFRRRAEQRRMRWSVRRMVEEFWDRGLGTLLPVWLCSPETVASAFPLRAGMFDLVVFDEASQCTLAHGLTVAYRGKTVVVAGDEQQLPPSNLWNASLEDEDDVGDEVVSEESLLSRARSAGSDMPLLWHYRSRFPQLIQFSNTTFYKGALKVAPVPVPQLQPAALEWVRAAGTWDKRENAAEAHLAVELIERYLREHPDRSIGVITLNRQQSDRIEDLVLERAERSPAFRELWDRAMQRDMDARPFVRNLENVQGDERDVILLSVAYSADASGRVPLRFGALTVGGGERRLNVAVSRARQKMVVLCSFDPETQLQVEDSKSEGARALREYLVYASRGGEGVGSGSTMFPRRGHAAIAEDVASALAARGWQADRDVGGSAARVDLAVRSRSQPGRYSLAVILDGPGAAWAGSAVSREVGRATYLRRYQWPVHELSARPWVMARDTVLDELVSRLEAEEKKLDQLSLPPTVSIPKQTIAPPMSPPARSARGPSSAAGVRAGAPRSTGTSGGPARAAAEDTRPAPGVIGPGSTVRYQRADGGEERIVVLSGPTVPRGAKAVLLDAPLAVAMLDASVGDHVWMEISSGNVELVVLEVIDAP
jgi:hypothetical protein